MPTILNQINNYKPAKLKLMTIIVFNPFITKMVTLILTQSLAKLHAVLDFYWKVVIFHKTKK